MRAGATIASSKVVPVLAAMLLGFLAWVAYLYFTYIDLIVESGTSYEISIGMSKRQVYDRLEAALYAVEGGDGNAFIDSTAEYRSADQKHDPAISGLVAFERNDNTFNFLVESNQWDFFLEKNYRDFLRLTFCDERLCKIYRHRKYFELP